MCFTPALICLTLFGHKLTPFCVLLFKLWDKSFELNFKVCLSTSSNCWTNILSWMLRYVYKFVCDMQSILGQVSFMLQFWFFSGYHIYGIYCSIVSLPFSSVPAMCIALNIGRGITFNFSSEPFSVLCKTGGGASKSDWTWLNNVWTICSHIWLWRLKQNMWSH